MKVNDKVICNGYAGTVIRTKDSLDSAWMGGMVEVRLNSGVVCVDSSELTKAIDVGTRIYYTGDMANHDGHFVVAAIRSPGCFDLRELPGDLSHDREFNGVYERNIGDVYHGHCNPRFVTEAARQAHRAAQMKGLS